MREENSGAELLLRNIFFSLEIVTADEGALPPERVAGVCRGAGSHVCTGLKVSALVCKITDFGDSRSQLVQTLHKQP